MKPRYAASRYSAGAKGMLAYLALIARKSASRNDLLVAFKRADKSDDLDKDIEKRVTQTIKNMLSDGVIVAIGEGKDRTYALGNVTLPDECDDDAPELAGERTPGRLTCPMTDPAYVPPHQPVSRAGALDFIHCHSRGIRC